MSYAVSILNIVATHRPADVLVHESEISKAYETNENLIFHVDNLLVKLANNEVNVSLELKVYPGSR